MYLAKVEVGFESAHRLFHYTGKCKNIHGHSYRAIVVLERADHVLAHPGFVIDFGDIRRIVKTWIDENWDHAIILWKDDPLCTVLNRYGSIKMFKMDSDPTAERMAKILYTVVSAELDEATLVTEVAITETVGATAIYRSSE